MVEMSSYRLMDCEEWTCVHICIHRMCTKQTSHSCNLPHRLGSAHTGANIGLCNNGNYDVELQTTVAIVTVDCATMIFG